MSSAKPIQPVETNDSNGADATASVSDLPLLPHLQQQQVNPEVSGVNYEAEAQKLEDKALVFLSKQARPVVTPPFAAWFKISEIHEIEKKQLPDFFNDSSRFKTSKAYKDARNFIINTYRLSPVEYLTMTAVRRNIAMDVSSIYKIYTFLEKWGLINYQVDPRSKPSLMGPSFTGHFQVILDTPQGLKPNVPSKSVKTEASDDSADLNREDSEVYRANLSLRKSAYDSTNDFNALQSSDKTSNQIERAYICHTCGIDTVVVRYHNLRSRDANLCSDCFQNGHFGSNFKGTDFIKLEKNVQLIRNTKWSDQEIVLLLEGLEMFQDQWVKIAEHIGGSKSIEQCIEKYLILPIEDKDIQDVMHKNTVSKSSILTSTSGEVTKLVDISIKSLVESLVESLNTKKYPSISTKYLQETQPVVQELTELTVQKLESKFEKLRKLEASLKISEEKFIKESETLFNDRMMLSKQIYNVNKELSDKNVQRKIVLLSQPSIQVNLLENNRTSPDQDTLVLKKLSGYGAGAPSQIKPEEYISLTL